MTESEAIEELKIALDAKGTGYGCLDKDTLRLSINALERQIPKKPDRWESGYACCYSCKRGIVREDNYCCYCGQKLDWSDEE